ncbi:type I secretion protein TolC [Lelliottia amnigena]|uniref:TolC family outer membrane protein n=1 Tax=Lelliottia amnigena TaxID=61646 RepID=UPI0010404B9D|nr:TolC family outer membrane protein [Lelliottia amnigena]TCD15533.1 type I secretion protein TolC [Lelliottia amnigena]
MGIKMPYWWLSCCLISVPVLAANPASVINPGVLSEEQELPSLNGRIAPAPGKAAPGTLKLGDAVNRAVNWHPTISEAVGKLYEQSEVVDIAKSKYYPQINAGMDNGFTHNGDGNNFTPSLVLSLSQMLYDFGKVASQVRAETAGVAQQQANVLVSIDTIAHDTALAMVQVQTWQQMVETAKEQLDALSSIGSLTRQRNDEGATSLSDVVQTDARIEGARAQLMQYTASLESSRATLMSFLGWNNLNQISNDFPDNLKRSCDIAEPDDRLVPAVLSAWAQANVAQANLDYANAQMTPTVSLEPEVRHYLNERYAGNETLDRTQYSAWVKVQMPLYQGGGLSARRNAAGHAVDAAQSTIQRTRLDVRQKLLESRSQVMSLLSTLQIQGRQEALSARTRELYQQQYLDLGTRPLLDVLNAEQEVYQARFTQQQTLGQLHQLQLSCLYNTGRLRHSFDLENRTIQTVEIQP